jgi:hypothetical protein
MSLETNIQLILNDQQLTIRETYDKIYRMVKNTKQMDTDLILSNLNCKKIIKQNVEYIFDSNNIIVNKSRIIVNSTNVMNKYDPCELANIIHQLNGNEIFTFSIEQYIRMIKSNKLYWLFAIYDDKIVGYMLSSIVNIGKVKILHIWSTIRDYRFPGLSMLSVLKPEIEKIVYQSNIKHLSLDVGILPHNEYLVDIYIQNLVLI